MSDKNEWNAFEATFHRILTAIMSDKPELSETMDWLKKTILYNVPHGKRNRGLAVVDTVRLIAEQQNRLASEEELELSRILGWTVEFLQAYFLVVDDVMDQSVTRRGQPCWFRKPDVGLIACNDATLLNQELYHILRIFFGEKEYYTKLFDIMHQTARFTAYGQCMDVLSSPPGEGPQLDSYTTERYKGIIKYKTAFYSFILPVRLAMYMCSIDSDQEHKMAEQILLKIGHMFQFQDDCIDCWGDPSITGKIGTDVEEGKCAWPIMTALQIATPEQLIILKQNFGKDDPNCVKKVKDVYEELNLKQTYLREEEKQYEEICQMIDQLKAKSKLNPKIFINFLNTIYKRQK